MTSTSKNMYIDKLADIVHENTSTYYNTIKIKPTDVKSNIYIDFSVKKNDKTILHLKLMIMWKCQIIKIFFPKVYISI